MNESDLSELSDYIKDTFDLLVLEPGQIEVEVSFVKSDYPEGDLELLVAVKGPRQQIALIIGRSARTARSCYRVFYSIARRMGFKGTLRLKWKPTEIGAGWNSVRDEAQMRE